MEPHVKPKHAELSEHEARLVDEIANAMHNRPLMSRLERVEAAYASELPSAASASRAAIGPGRAMTPPPIPEHHRTAASSAAGASNAGPIDRLMADNDDALTSPPPSAEWLDKARRERSRARLRNAAAWLATLAIGGAIVSTTMLMLQT